MLALCIVAIAPGLYPGYWQTVEGFVPVFNVAQPAALANIATAPDFWRGSGVGALLPAQPLLLLGFTPLAATRAVLLSCLVVGALAIYGWLHPRMGDRAAGLAGLLYAFLPVSLAAVYRQGSLADALFLALLPVALLSISTYAAHRSIAAAAATVAAIVLLGRTQAGAGLLAALLLALYAGFVERRPSAVLTIVVAQVAALLWMFPLWNAHAAPAIPFANQFTSLFGLLRSGWRAGDSVQFGVVAFVLAVVALWALLAGPTRLDADVRRLLTFSVVAVLVIYALTLPWSAGLWQVTRAQELLRSPMQVVLLAGPFAAALAGGALLSLADLRRTALWTTLAALIVLAALPDLQPVYTQVAPARIPAATFGNNDLVVLSAAVDEAPDRQQARLDVTWQTLHPLAHDANLFFQAVDTSGSPAVVAQLDAAPVDGEPATTWQPGTIHTAAYTLTLPANAAAPLTYYFGLYDWRDGSRLPVNGGLDDKMVFHGE